jgi:hypothetical protein
MVTADATSEPTIVRQAFETWSIEIPETFSETFVSEGNYWHAWDRHRSVSLSSTVLTDRGRPVSATRALRRLRPIEGERVSELPPDLVGWAVAVDVPQPARASRALTGMLAIDGRILVATITAEDPAWARSVWLSIRRTDRPAHSKRSRHS